jgi:hypothetical protein
MRHGMMADVAQENRILRVALRPELGEASGERT